MFPSFPLCILYTQIEGRPPASILCLQMLTLMAALPPTTTPPEFQKPFLALDNEKRVIRQRLQKTHPDYTVCFGHKAFTYSASFGTIIGWSITGHLAHTVTNIQKTVLDLIRQKLQDLQTPIKHYAIRCYLLGCKKSRAAPHVVALCSDEKFSQSLRTIIIDSNILPDRWYCFRLPYNVITLTMPQPSSILSGEIGQYKVFVPGETVPEHLNAISIEIWKDDEYIGSATIGGVVDVGGQVFALTVAHAFCSTQSQEPEPFVIDESELGFFRSGTKSDFACLEKNSFEAVGDDDDEDSEDDDWKCSSPTTGFLSSSSGEMLNKLSLSEPTPTSGGRILIGHLIHISNLKDDAMKDMPNLDWALISLEHLAISSRNERGVNGEWIRYSSLETVIISRSSSDLSGRFLEDAVFGLPAGSSPQPVLTVKVDETFDMGDSGSWLLHPGNENVLGMLIGACPSLSEAYFLRIEDIWKDVERQTGMKPSIAPLKDDSISSANNSRSPLHQSLLLESDIIAAISDTSSSDVHTSVEMADSNDDRRSVTAQSLKGKMEEVLIFSDEGFPGQRFLPEDKANDLLTKRTIELELEAGGLTPDEWLVDTILKKAAKIFFTLVWIENIQTIEELLKDGIDDRGLPVQLREKYNYEGGSRWVVGSLKQISSETTSSHWPIFETWNLSHINEFIDNQWLLLAPVLSYDTFWYDLGRNCPLPFLRPEKRIFSRNRSIHHTELHNAHQKLRKPVRTS